MAIKAPQEVGNHQLPAFSERSLTQNFVKTLERFQRYLQSLMIVYPYNGNIFGHTQLIGFQVPIVSQVVELGIFTPSTLHPWERRCFGRAGQQVSDVSGDSPPWDLPCWVSRSLRSYKVFKYNSHVIKVDFFISLQIFSMAEAEKLEGGELSTCT